MRRIGSGLLLGLSLGFLGLRLGVSLREFRQIHVRLGVGSGLGVRLTGRAPTLRALLDQSPATVADWLKEHATRWEERHTRRDGTDGFWTQRARHLGRLLATDRTR